MLRRATMILALMAPASMTPVLGQEEGPPDQVACFAQGIDQPADLQHRMASCYRVIGDGSVGAGKRAEAYLRHALAHAQQVAISGSNEGIDRALAPLAGRPALKDPQLQKSIHETRARLYLRKGDFDRAIADYTASISLDPHSAVAYARRGMAYRSLGKTSEAVADMQRALSLDPSDASVKEALRLAETSAPAVGRGEDKAANVRIELLKAELQQAREAAKAMQERLAALEAGKTPTLPPAPPPTESLTPAPDAANLARDLQRELKRVGCYPGTIDARWGRTSQLALQRFAQYAALALPSGEPTVAALGAVSARQDRVCPLACASNEAVVNGRCVASRASTRRKRPQAHKRGGRSRQTSSGRPRGGSSIGITIGIGRGGGIGVGF